MSGKSGGISKTLGVSAPGMFLLQCKTLAISLPTEGFSAITNDFICFFLFSSILFWVLSDDQSLCMISELVCFVPCADLKSIVNEIFVHVTKFKSNIF